MTILQDDINTVVNRVIQHENQKLPDEIKIKLISLHYTDDKYVTYVLRDNKHIDTKNNVCINNSKNIRNVISTILEYFEEVSIIQEYDEDDNGHPRNRYKITCGIFKEWT